MHRLIRVLVFGQNETEALDAARRVVQDHLVGDFPTSGAPFDNAVDFTNSAADSGGLSGEMAVAQRCRETMSHLGGGLAKIAMETYLLSCRFQQPNSPLTTSEEWSRLSWPWTISEPSSRET